MAIDWSKLIGSASPLSSGGIDPDQWIANGGKDDDQGVSYQAKPGEKRTTLGPTSALPPKPYATGVSRPPDDGNVRSTSSPAGNAPNPVSEAPSDGAVPSTVSPSGGFSDVRRQALMQQMGILGKAQSIPSAPDIGGLESQRVAAAGQAPDPNASQFRPSIGRRIARGVEGVGLGLAEGGLRGALAGGIAPQTTGLAGYKDPNSAFFRAKEANDQTVGGLDQQIKTAQDQENARSEGIKDLTGVASGLGSVASESTAGQNADTSQQKEAFDETEPPKLPEGEMPLGQTAPQLQKTLEDRYQVIHKGQPLPPEFKLPPNATQKDYDRIDKALEGVEKAHGTLDQQAQTNAFRQTAQAMQETALGMREKNADSKTDTKTKEATLKAFTPVQDSAERVNIMTQNAEDALKGNQQAGLSLVSNHIGMTMGLVKGARINKEVYDHAIASQPWLSKVGAHFSSDGYLDGVALSPKMIGQMVDLAPGRLSEDTKKARSTAKYLGSSDDGPDRTPSRSTMRYYLFKAGGDKAKAKAAAAADGWTVTDAGK